MPPTLQALADAVIWTDGPPAEAVATMLADAGYGLHDTDTARRLRMLMGVYQPRYTPLERGSAHCNASGARLGVDDLRARLDAAEDEARELRQLLGVGP